PFRVESIIPDFQIPEGGLNIRWPDPPLAQEQRLLEHKLYAALAYARANRIDRVVMDSSNARIGIITAGKSYLDVCQALEMLGIDAEQVQQMGLRVIKWAWSGPSKPKACAISPKAWKRSLWWKKNAT